MTSSFLDWHVSLLPVSRKMLTKFDVLMLQTQEVMSDFLLSRSVTSHSLIDKVVYVLVCVVVYVALVFDRFCCCFFFSFFFFFLFLINQKFCFSLFFFSGGGAPPHPRFCTNPKNPDKTYRFHPWWLWWVKMWIFFILTVFKGFIWTSVLFYLFQCTGLLCLWLHPTCCILWECSFLWGRWNQRGTKNVRGHKSLKGVAGGDGGGVIKLLALQLAWNLPLVIKIKILYLFG